MQNIDALNQSIKDLQDKLSYAYDARKQAIRLYYKRGYSIAEIGRAFNMPKQNVSRVVHTD